MSGCYITGQRKSREMFQARQKKAGNYPSKKNVKEVMIPTVYKLSGESNAQFIRRNNNEDGCIGACGLAGDRRF